MDFEVCFAIAKQNYSQIWLLLIWGMEKQDIHVSPIDFP